MEHYQSWSDSVRQAFGRFLFIEAQAMRVINIANESRGTIKEQDGSRIRQRIEELIGYINGLLPRNEVIGRSRKQLPL